MASLGVSARWIETRRRYWEKLEKLVNACGRRGIAALTHDELRELALLYRQTAADLSVARDDPSSGSLARYLNLLLGRAHNLIYSGPPPGTVGIFQFYARVFPAVFRRTLPYTLAAFALFVIGALAGSAMAATDPSFERVVLGGPMMDSIEAGRMWTHSIVGIKPLASSAIMTNNISVSIAAFGGGVLAGVGTVYMMLFNGLLLGVIAVACQRAGLALSLWSFVVPHGVLELPAIFIAGGAGLMLARALLAPGELTRHEALVEAGSLAVRLVLGVIPLLIVAGTIEGFISPSDAAPAAKFAIGIAGAALLAGYVTLIPQAVTEDSVP